MKNFLRALLFAAAACSQPVENQQKTKPVAAADSNKTNLDGDWAGFSVLDSLKIYSGRDSFEIRLNEPNAVLIFGKANNQKFAIWAIEDSTATTFQFIENQWIEIEKVVYKDHYPLFRQHDDLNGDSFQDINLCTPSGAAGNLVSFVFLFDPTTKRFRHSNSFSGIANCSYEKNGHFVKSFWVNSSVYGCPVKWKYKIFKDSLALEKGVKICPDEKSETQTIEIFKMVGGKEVVLKRQTGAWEKMEEIFTNTLWDSSEDYF